MTKKQEVIYSFVGAFIGFFLAKLIWEFIKFLFN